MFKLQRRNILSYLIIITITLNISSFKANADDNIIYCGNTDIVWQDYSFGSEGASSDDLIAQGLSTNLGVNGAIWSWGSFPQLTERCQANLIQETNTNPDIDIVLDPSCEMTEEEREKCAGLEIMNATLGDSGSKRMGRSHGLIGVAYSLETGLEDPIPLNMAYFMKRNAQKIPLINKTAYAQTSTTYYGPLLGVVYDYWTITRNIAYGLMAIIMLIIGIMIITQRKLDAKSALTVQQAIPQLIIAIILIYASYPIGATAASLAYGLLESSTRWAIDIFALKDVSVPAATAGMGMSFLQSLGSAIMSWLLNNITSLVAAVYFIIVLLKIFGIYLKMLLGVISAPLIFAIGAIPGQQKNTINWFKQMGANVVAIPVTMLAFEIVKALGYELAETIFLDYDSFAQTYRGNMLGGYVTFIIPAISFMGMGLVTKIPSQIEKIFGLSK